MNPLSPAIVRAFDEKLPDERLVMIPSDETYRPIRSSASSTLEADPVAIYFEETTELYHN